MSDTRTTVTLRNWSIWIPEGNEDLSDTDSSEKMVAHPRYSFVDKSKTILVSLFDSRSQKPEW